MTTEHVKTLFRARPFQPFVMHLADGREITVPHPDFTLISPSGRTVIVSNPDDTFNIVDLLLVTDIHVTSKNGSKRRKR